MNPTPLFRPLSESPPSPSPLSQKTLRVRSVLLVAPSPLVRSGRPELRRRRTLPAGGPARVARRAARRDLRRLLPGRGGAARRGVRQAFSESRRRRWRSKKAGAEIAPDVPGLAVAVALLCGLCLVDGRGPRPHAAGVTGLALEGRDGAELRLRVVVRSPFPATAPLCARASRAAAASRRRCACARCRRAAARRRRRRGPGPHNKNRSVSSRFPARLSPPRSRCARARRTEAAPLKYTVYFNTPLVYFNTPPAWPLR